MPALGDHKRAVGRLSSEVWLGRGRKQPGWNASSQTSEVGGKLGQGGTERNVELLPGCKGRTGFPPPLSSPPHQWVIFPIQTFQPHPSLGGQTPLAPRRLPPASLASPLERPEARSLSADTLWWKQLITRWGKCARTLA